jgi:flagellin FlaB
MEVKMPHKREKGQVGIGTLIVFIAMVLVAAIAAGVLINTAGFLQSQSEQTGQESSSQVSDRLQVVNTVGEDTDGDSQLDIINMTVKKAPGANDIDLSVVTIQWITDEEILDLTSTGAESDGSFGIRTIQDDDGSISGSTVVNDPEDRAVVEVNDSSPGAGITPLGEGQTAEVKFNTQAGGETTVTLVVPESLSGVTTVSL